MPLDNANDKELGKMVGPARYAGATVETPPHQLLDEDFPSSEQLPRRFQAIFRQSIRNGKPYVTVTCNGKQAGDELTDNSYVDDGFRFHDVVHYGLAALLGWSPMTRKLLNCKRRSVPRVDEVEDGGRARVIEEAVCALIYDYARKQDDLTDASDVDPELIRVVRSLTWDREVSVRSPSEWEHAIRKICVIWRTMWRNAGGVLKIDLNERRLDYSPE